MEIQTVDEGELELVCEAPPAKKKTPANAVVVDLTLSSSESGEDSGDDDEDKEQDDADEKKNGTELLVNRNTGSQSSRPSTAESVDTSATGIHQNYYLLTSKTSNIWMTRNFERQQRTIKFY